jgi:hypothetical protein
VRRSRKTVPKDLQPPVQDDWPAQFLLAANAPWRWVHVAQRLKVAASALGDLTLRDHERFYWREAEFSSLEHFETFAPALMLYGLALENLAKGLVVAGRANGTTADSSRVRTDRPAV